MKIATNLGVAGRFARRSLALVTLLAPGIGLVPLALAQSPVAIFDPSTPIALTTNNTGSAATYVLNADSSVNVLQNTGIVGGARCGPILSGTTVSRAAIAFDSSTNRLYAVIEGDSSTGSGLGTVVTYATISGGTCTFGPTVQVSTTSFALVDLAVDPTQGNVYVLEATQGGALDVLYILNIAAFASYPANPVPQVFLDYSATYGPILIDSTTGRVYINDFGSATNLPPGLNPSPGFFVYDPNYSPTVTSNIQHVFGYVNSSNATLPLSAQASLVNSGDLILANQNTSISLGHGATFLTSPFTILHTNAPGFSFFANTQPGPFGSSSGVYIQPGTSGITTVGPGGVGTSIQNYSATGGADLDTAHGIIYRYAYNVTSSNSFSATPQQDSGALVSYNLATQVDSTLTQNGFALANVYPTPNTTPWSQLTFNAASDNVTLAVPSAALGVSNSLACTGVTVQQVLGGGSTYLNLGEAAVNSSSGYVYDTQTVFPTTTLYYVAPPASCVLADLVLSPAALPAGTAGQPYGAQFSVATGTVGTVTFSTPTTPISPFGLSLSSSGSLSGTPTQVGTFEVTVAAKDTAGDTGSETVSLTINCQTITVGPNPLPGAVVGIPYSIAFTQTGGIGSLTYQAFGPFPPGILPTANGLSGTPTSTGSFPIGIQVTDSNGCQSQNTIQTLTVSTPKFLMGPASSSGSPQCSAPGPGFPFTVVPTVTIYGISYFQVNVNLINYGNVSVTANITSAILRSSQAVNAIQLGVPVFPISFNNAGTLLAPGGCVSLTFYYPTTDFTSVILPDGFTQANIPQRLGMQGTFSASTSLTTYSGNWSLTDPRVDLSSALCCNVGGGGIGGTSGNPYPYTGPMGTIPPP
jgi:hypothetical protein